jgi:hypothetical protein
MSAASERKRLIEVAKRAGVEVKRGEDAASIRARMQRHDEEQFKAVVGDDAPSVKQRRGGAK